LKGLSGYGAFRELSGLAEGDFRGKKGHINGLGLVQNAGSRTINQRISSSSIMVLRSSIMLVLLLVILSSDILTILLLSPR
jgi:hypothetical protein